MAKYAKFLILYLLLFSILYIGLTITVNLLISNTPEQYIINIANILTYSCWGVTAYLFAEKNGRFGVLNGAFFGITTLVVVILFNTRGAFSSGTDLQAALVPYIGTSLILGGAGGLMYDIIHLFKRIASNQSLKRDGSAAP
jgi:hypothetical protein